MDKIQIIAIIAVLFFIGLIARFIMKGKLRTEYSIIWILMGFMFLVFSIWRQSLDLLAKFFGVYYAPALIFIFFLIFAFEMIQQFQIVFLFLIST